MKNMSTFNKMQKNIAKEETSKTKERDEYALSVASDLLSIIQESKLIIGEEDQTKILEVYTPIYEKIMKIFLLRKTKIRDIGYILSHLSEPIDFLKDLVLNSVNANLDLANAKLFGVNDMKDITINDLDEKMKS